MEEHEKKILFELKKQINCSKNFPCIQLDINNLCKAKYTLHNDLLECLEEKPINCEFAAERETIYLCKCILRKHIAKNLEKWISEEVSIIKKID